MRKLQFAHNPDFVNLKTKSAGDGHRKKAIEKTILRFLGSRTVSHSLGGEGTFSAPANLTRPSSPIAAPMRDQLEWRLDRRPLHQNPGRELGYTRYDKMARRWAGKSNMSKSPR